MSFVDQAAGSFCSAAHDLFRDGALGPSLFSVCRVAAVRSSAGFICVEKALSETEAEGRGDNACVHAACIY